MDPEVSNRPEGVVRRGSASQPSRTALLVVGMHRSGTSAVARMLSFLGAALPEHVMGTEYRGRRGNETGHWEPERLVDLHDEMLAEVGSHWDDWRRFDPTTLGPERLSHYRSAIAWLIAEEYGDASLFVLKDPRLCRFVPLYEEILGGMGIAPRFVLPHRNPVSVLDSLATRDDMTASYASLIWLRHVLDAEEATRGKPRVFLAYEECLDDWRTVAAMISAAFGLDWPRSVDDAGQEIDAHLSRDLQHHAATPADLAADQRIGQVVRDAYEALLALTADDGDAAALETLSRVRGEFESGQPFFADAMVEEMFVRQNRDRINREHLQRLVTMYQGEARKNAEAKSDLQTQLAASQHELRAAHIQATERESILTQLSTERAALETQLAERESVLTRLLKERTALARQLTTLRNTAASQATEIGRLGSEHAALRAQIKALETSTSWRLTMPLRAAKLLTTDPRGAIALFRARGLDVPAPPAAFPSASTPVVKPPRTYAGRKPLPGLERRTPDEVARVVAAFNADFYLTQYPEVAAAGVDPFEHYMVYGWKEGRDPSPTFDTRYYLKHAPDVAKVGINPFLHWIFYGTHEKRPTLPFRRRLELLDYTPKVSAIVPNYNHARFLEQRLDSILAQTYKNIEILILDDCSTDGSRAIIERYCKKYLDRIRALFNDRNSGNVFRQWHKGIENTSGELIWICESDDFCEPDFLETLVKNFKDRSVNIAFGRVQFSDKDGNLQPGLDEYREGAEPGIWDASLTRPARRWFAGGFGINNVIANVGGCIFRRHSLSEPVWGETENYSILGDWFLYCHLAGGGQIAYEPSAVAYFRQHSGNTSVASFVSPGYYEEHERLMLLLRQRWGVPDETVEAFYQKVAFQYARHGLEEKFGPLESYCDILKLLTEKRTRPHILIAFLGFHLGGGEVFPIDLANELHAQGYLVSMLALDMSDVKREMLAALDPAIPVYDSAWVQEYGADRFLTEAGVSLIHSHMVSLEWFFFEKCRIETEIPYLVTLHGSYEASALSKERLLSYVRRVTHFVYTADKNLEPLRALPLPEKIFTKLSNARPVDPRPFPKTRQELGIAEDTVVFTLVARGIKRKGWRAAIAAFRRLREANPEREMHLLLCGEGEEADRQFALHGDDPDITFLGYQSRIHGLYRMSDVAIVPTRFAGESFPFCIIEALQTETPVVATRIGEIGSMIDGPDGAAGILIEYQRDTDLFIRSLQEAMAAMLQTSERERYARAAREKGETYSMDRVARDYAALYESMLAQRVH
jgi:glycosyltransferase involved in cell wall biosynthesis